MGEFIFNQLKFVSAFGDNIIVISFVVGMFMVYLYKKGHEKSAFLTLMTIVSYAYSLYLKSVYRVSRPATAEISRYLSYDVYSFPSSHVVFYTVFWGFVIYLSYKYIKESNLILHVIRVLSIYFISMVGISRVALGEHYVRDVIGGYAFGIIFLGILIWLDYKLDKDLSKDKKNNSKRTKR